MTNRETYNIIRASTNIEELYFEETLELYLESTWYNISDEMKHFKQVCKYIGINYNANYINVLFLMNACFKNPVFFKNINESIVKKEGSDKTIFLFKLGKLIEFWRGSIDRYFFRLSSNDIHTLMLNEYYKYVNKVLESKVLEDKQIKYLKYIILDNNDAYFISADLDIQGKLKCFVLHDLQYNKITKISKVLIKNVLSNFELNIYYNQNNRDNMDLVGDIERYQCDFGEVSKIVDIHKEGIVVITYGRKFTGKYEP